MTSMLEALIEARDKVAYNNRLAWRLAAADYFAVKMEWTYGIGEVLYTPDWLLVSHRWRIAN